jgi:hypothetical protein
MSFVLKHDLRITLFYLSVPEVLANSYCFFDGALQVRLIQDSCYFEPGAEVEKRGGLREH